MPRFYILVLVYGLVGFSCDSPSISKDKVEIPDELNKVIALSSITQELKFTPLLGEDRLLPYDADKVDFTEDLILIADLALSQSLFVFDKSSFQALEIPLKKGDGPKEIREVTDFWVDEDVIYVLDGIGRKIIPLAYSDRAFKIMEPIFLDIPLRRFAKTKTGFVGLTGGGQENALAFLDPQGKVQSSHFPLNISFLMSPLNPFHKVFEKTQALVLYHSPFDPTLFRVDGGFPEEFSTFKYEGSPVKKPVNFDFRMDGEGFNSFRETLKFQPSFFTLFEYNADQLILLYFLDDIPRLGLKRNDQGYSFRLENLKNDLTFDQPFPKVTGVTSTGFVALVTVDQINNEGSAFGDSHLKRAIQNFPEARIFLFEFQLKID